MKKFAVFILVAVLLFAAGCGAEEAETAAVSVDDVKTALGDIVADTYTMDASAVLTQYGIKAEEVAAMSCCFKPVTVFNDEFLMFEAVDSSAADSIEQKLQNHYDSLEAQANDYDPDMAALLDDCRIQRNGCYVAMFISLSAPQAQEIWEGFFK